MRLLIILLLSSPLFGWEHSEWLKDVEAKKHNDALSWLKEQLQRELGESKPTADLSSIDQCKTCFRGGVFDDEPELYVFMSFSIPDNIWLELSKQIDECSGIFVLRGLPENSFQELANKVALLKEKGMETSIQVAPQLFKEYGVEQVPAFVFVDKEKSHKVTGAISLEYALKLKENESGSKI